MADKWVTTITTEKQPGGCLIMLVPLIGVFVALAAGVAWAIG